MKIFILMMMVVVSQILAITEEADDIQILGISVGADGDIYAFGSGEFKDIDVTQFVNKEHIDSLSAFSGSTIADLLISSDGRWIVSGRIGLIMPMKQTSGGLEINPAGVTKIVLFNQGYKVTVTIEKGAVALIRGKRVRALKKTTFLLKDGNDVQFLEAIKNGSLQLLSKE